jgi:hypothetical protein
VKEVKKEYKVEKFIPQDWYDKSRN